MLINESGLAFTFFNRCVVYSHLDAYLLKERQLAQPNRLALPGNTALRRAMLSESIAMVWSPRFLVFN